MDKFTIFEIMSELGLTYSVDTYEAYERSGDQNEFEWEIDKNTLDELNIDESLKEKVMQLPISQRVIVTK